MYNLKLIAMKKTTALLLSLFLTITSIIAKEVTTEKRNILTDKRGEITIDAVIKALNTTNTYAIEYSGADLKSITPPSILGRKSAKEVELNAEADYIFEIDTKPIGEPVVTIMTVDEATHGVTPDFNYIAAMDFYAYFVVKVKNRAGDILKTIVVSTPDIAHRYYLCVKINRGQRSVKPTISDDIFDRQTTGWFSAAQLNAIFDRDHSYLLNSTYREINTSNMKTATAALNKLFNNTTISSNDFKIYSIKGSAQGDFTTISTATEDLKIAAQKWTTNQNDSQLNTQLGKYGDAFLGYALQSKDKNLKVMCLANASLAYTLCGNFDKALAMATNAIKLRPSIGNSNSSESILYRTLKTDAVYKNSDPIYAYLNYLLAPNPFGN